MDKNDEANAPLSTELQDNPPAYPEMASGAVQHVASTADGQYQSTAGGFQSPDGESTC